jgi:hypothetical protein
MSEEFQQKDSLPAPSHEQAILAMLKKIEQRLDFLENKIDTLINQPSSRPPQERHFSKPFSKPFRSFGPPHHRPDRERGSFSGGKSFGGGDRFEHKKKEFDAPREGGFSREPRFEKRPRHEGGGFGGSKKHFPFKRRQRP